MRVLISLSQRFKSYEGRLYAPTCSYEQLWKRYLTVFDSVLIMARVEEVDALEGVLVEATGPGVDFFPLPDYHGPWEFLYQQPRLRKLATQAVDQSDAFILRVPCHVGSLAWWELRRRRRPYAIEVVADPWLSLAPGSVKTAARPVFRRLAVNQLRRICRGASASMYVTRQALQRLLSPRTKHIYRGALGCRVAGPFDRPGSFLTASENPEHRRSVASPRRTGSPGIHRHIRCDVQGTGRAHQGSRPMSPPRDERGTGDVG